MGVGIILRNRPLFIESSSSLNKSETNLILKILFTYCCMSIEISLSSLESSSARRQKAESRYRTALESLHKVLLKEKFTNSELFPTINDTNAVTIASRASELEAAINHISKSTKSAQNVQSRTRIVVEMFQGLYPFMQLLHKAADAAMHVQICQIYLIFSYLQNLMG